MTTGDREAAMESVLEMRESGAETRDMRHLQAGHQPGAGAVVLVQGGEVVAEVHPAMWLRFYPSREIVYLSLQQTDRLISELLSEKR